MQLFGMHQFAYVSFMHVHAIGLTSAKVIDGHTVKHAKTMCRKGAQEGVLAQKTHLHLVNNPTTEDKI